MTLLCNQLKMYRNAMVKKLLLYYVCFFYKLIFNKKIFFYLNSVTPCIYIYIAWLNFSHVIEVVHSFTLGSSFHVSHINSTFDYMLVHMMICSLWGYLPRSIYVLCIQRIAYYICASYIFINGLGGMGGGWTMIWEELSVWVRTPDTGRSGGEAYMDAKLLVSVLVSCPDGSGVEG